MSEGRAASGGAFPAQRRHGGPQLAGGNGQRRREADDVGGVAFGQEDEPAPQQRFHQGERAPGGRGAVGVADFDAGQQALAADAQLGAAGVAGERRERGQQDTAQPGAAPRQVQPPDFPNLRQGHGAADGMAQKGAGVDGFAVGRRPRGVHEVGAADAGGEREAAGQGFAEANHVRDRSGVFAGKPFPGAAEAGVDFIQNQQGAVLVAEPAQEGQEARRGEYETVGAVKKCSHPAFINGP